MSEDSVAKILSFDTRNVSTQKVTDYNGKTQFCPTWVTFIARVFNDGRIQTRVMLTDDSDGNLWTVIDNDNPKLDNMFAYPGAPVWFIEASFKLFNSGLLW